MSSGTRLEAPPGLVVGGRRNPVASTPSAASGFPTRMLFTIFLIFSFPAFTIQLAMDMTTGSWRGSPVLQVVTISTELYVFAVIFSSREIRSLALRCWPIWVLVSTAVISATWSLNLSATFHESNTYLTTVLLGLAMVGALPHFQCIRTAVRAMVLGCVLSVVWVFVFPAAAIHQLTDPYQTVHAGLWRGIFSHKQGLGYFAGLTTGLLLFYRTTIFPMPLLAVSLACSVACLIGTQSATGVVAMAITPALLYFCNAVMRRPPPARRSIFFLFVMGCVGIAAAYELGLMNFVIVHVLGKSTDLTGRAEFWPIILENLRIYGIQLARRGVWRKSRDIFVPMER